MRRRDFCSLMGSSLVLSAGRGLRRVIAAEGGGTPSWTRDTDPAGGFTVTPPREVIFTDYRHIRPSDLSWQGPDGRSLPVAGPPDPPVQAMARADGLPRGIRLVAQSATKQGPVDNLPGRIIFDDGRYRSWSLRTNYPAGKNLGSYSKAAAQSVTVQYAESKDGHAWTSRDVCEVKVSNVTGIDGDCFFIDPHGPADERYKIVYHALVLSPPAAYWEAYSKLHPRYRDQRLRKDNINCLFALVSPDGQKWKAVAEPLMVHKGDTDNSVYWDEWLGRYVLYTRLYWMDRRMIARAESEDFRHWTPVEPIVAPGLDDPFSYDIYTNGRTCYPGLPGQHLMFPMFYRRYTQTSEIRLLSSIDGIRWQQVPGGAVISPGDPGQWDGEFIGAGKGLVPLGKDHVGIPYFGSTHPHKYPRWPGVIRGSAGWAIWPKGRLSGLVADEEGEFRTFGIEIAGRQLRVNAKVRRAGELRVGLDGVEGRGAGECDPIVGDGLAHPVTWKGRGELGRDEGQTVALHFRLRAGELYGFEWV
ncbi:MAG: hypothetical protein JXQ73_33815 [Phycisphaerae bacterium]|nr:hypothetical protein [Phycisphaerae bacterium]